MSRPPTQSAPQGMSNPAAAAQQPPMPAPSAERRPTADPVEALLQAASRTDGKAMNLEAMADEVERKAQAQAEEVIRQGRAQAEEIRADAAVYRNRAARWREIVGRERQSEAALPGRVNGATP